MTKGSGGGTNKLLGRLGHWSTSITKEMIPFVSPLLYFLLCNQLNQVYVSDEQLGRSIKITPAMEDAYVFKGNWLSGFKDASSAAEWSMNRSFNAS